MIWQYNDCILEFLLLLNNDGGDVKFSLNVLCIQLKLSENMEEQCVLKSE